MHRLPSGRSSAVYSLFFSRSFSLLLFSLSVISPFCSLSDSLLLVFFAYFLLLFLAAFVLLVNHLPFLFFVLVFAPGLLWLSSSFCVLLSCLLIVSHFCFVFFLLLVFPFFRSSSCSCSFLLLFFLRKTPNRLLTSSSCSSSPFLFFVFFFALCLFSLRSFFPGFFLFAFCSSSSMNRTRLIGNVVSS